MKIALIGYGKMGQEIERVAVARGHEVVLRLTSAGRAEAKPETLSSAEVAIEFTRPDAAVSNIRLCFDAGIPVVTGTTGWYEQLGEMRDICTSNQKTMLYASNFSLGVNILFELNKKLARTMNQYPQYNVSIDEIHHIRKLDSPSGTAITLANDIVENISRKKNWIPFESAVENIQPDGTDSVIIHSSRIGDATGTHIVKYTSENDVLELRHEAFNRKGFAEGAVIAAEWIVGKKGCFTMSDVLNFNS